MRSPLLEAGTSHLAERLSCGFYFALAGTGLGIWTPA